MQEQEINNRELHNFSINLKELAKGGFIAESIKVRGNTKEEVKQRLNEAVEITQDKLKELATKECE